MPSGHVSALTVVAVAALVIVMPASASAARIFTIAGTGDRASAPEGGTATDIPLAGIHRVAAAPNGDVLIATRDSRVWRLGLDGRLQVIAGTLTGGTAVDGVTATHARLESIGDNVAT